MTKEALIKKALETLSRLPQDRIREVNDYADYILKKYEEDSLQEGMQQLMGESKAYTFLEDEEDLYTLEDLKERYHSQLINKQLGKC